MNVARLMQRCAEHGGLPRVGCVRCDGIVALAKRELAGGRVRAQKLRLHLSELVLLYAADDVVHSVSPSEVSRARRALCAAAKAYANAKEVRM